MVQNRNMADVVLQLTTLVLIVQHLLATVLGHSSSSSVAVSVAGVGDHDLPLFVISCIHKHLRSASSQPGCYTVSLVNTHIMKLSTTAGQPAPIILISCDGVITCSMYVIILPSEFSCNFPNLRVQNEQLHCMQSQPFNLL